MSEVNEYWVRKGGNVPRLGLLDQARVHRELCEVHATRLREYGLTDDLIREFDEAIELVSSERAAAIEARTASKSNFVRQENVVTEAKALKRRLVLAFNDLRASRQLSAHVLRAITKSGRLRRSPTLISGYFTDIRPHVEQHAERLKPYFGGVCPLVRVDAIVAELDSAQATQEADLSALPLETRKVYEAKGRLLVIIEKINRIAKIAFDGDEMTMAVFNKDLLDRARQKRRSMSKVELLGSDALGAEAEETG